MIRATVTILQGKKCAHGKEKVPGAEVPAGIARNSPGKTILPSDENRFDNVGNRTQAQIFSPSRQQAYPLFYAADRIELDTIGNVESWLID